MGTHPIFESDFDCLTDLSQQISHPRPSHVVEISQVDIIKLREKEMMETEIESPSKKVRITDYFSPKKILEKETKSQNVKIERPEVRPEVVEPKIEPEATNLLDEINDELPSLNLDSTLESVGSSHSREEEKAAQNNKERYISCDNFEEQNI